MARFSRSLRVIILFCILPLFSLTALASSGHKHDSGLIAFDSKKQSCCGAAENAEFSPLANPEYESYRLTAVYYSLHDGVATTLMLNNKGPQPLPATPTLYSMAGTRLTLAPIIVPAASYIEVDMHTLLARAADEFREGSMKIAYTGGSLQLGAQVRMIDADRKLIWAEQFVYATKFLSNRLESVWWLPFNNSQTRLAVSNTSRQTITVNIEADGTAPSQTAPYAITLAPWETRMLDIMRDVAGHENGHLKDKGGVSITHTGTPGAILARMYVSEPNRGYSASIPFIDPEATATQKWHGAGLRLRMDGEDLDSVLVARNTGDEPTTISGRVPYTQPNGDMDEVIIPSRNIPANSTRIINLRHLIDTANIPNAVIFAGIEINYTSPKGTVLTTVQSMSQDGEHVFQVPMIDPEKIPSSSGGFPWKADGGFRTLVYIKNETGIARKYTVAMIYPDGNGYSLGQKDIKPGETVVIDFKKIRDEQTPDSVGKLVPLDLEKGQIHWSAVGQEAKTLSGRSEQIDASGGIASTYACYGCCENTFSDAWLSPFNEWFWLGTYHGFRAFQQDTNCNGQTMPEYEVTTLLTWEALDPSVMSVASSGEAYAVGPGTSYIRASWNVNHWDGSFGYCARTTENIQRETPVEVRPSVSIDSFKAVGKDQTAIIKVTVNSNPGNANITLTLAPNPGSGVAHFTSTNDTTQTIQQTTNVEIKGITESSTKDNMRFTASSNGSSVGNSESFTVISITLSLRLLNTQTVSTDNSARSTQYDAVGTYQLGGPFLSSGTTSAVLWRHVVEVIGTILPSNYSDAVVLRREVLATRQYNEANTLTDSQGPFADDSNPLLRDDNPQSGSSQGKIYDLDSPGSNLSVPPFSIGNLRRRRTNFRQWATISQKQGGVTTDVRMSPYIEWFHRLSVIVNASGVTQINNDVANDNQIGSGTTAISWNLQ